MPKLGKGFVSSKLDLSAPNEDSFAVVSKFTDERPPPEQRAKPDFELGRRFLDLAAVAFSQPLPFSGGVTVVTFGQGTWAAWAGQADIKLRLVVLSIPSKAPVYVPFENIKYYELVA